MNCNTNTQTPVSLEIQYFTNPNCFDCGGNCGGQIYNSQCVIYTGPNLSCSGVNTNDSIETALQKIDTQICSVVGDYSQYNMHCLPDWWGETITTQSDFVDAITSFICDLSDSYTTFTGTTYPTYTAATNIRIVALEVPEITCSFASVIDTDTLSEVLSKYCTAFSTLNDKFDLSTVVWDNCLTVVSTPETLPEAFQLVEDQLCVIKGLVTNSQLPSFNNYGSCIDGTSNDSLVTTIGLIKTRLCLTPTFNINTLDWTCLTKPSSTQTDLQSAFQTVLDTLSDYTQNKATFSEDFVITPTGDSPCDGVTVSLASPPILDRLVAATALDDTPGTLQDKLEAGDNVDLDFSDPTKCVISATTEDTYKVKSDISESDGMAGFLTSKIKGVVNKGIGIDVSYDDPAKKTRLTPSVDESALWNTLYDFLNIDLSAKAKFCALVSGCIQNTTSQYRYSLTNNGANDPPESNIFTLSDVTNPSSPTIVATFSVIDGVNVPLTNYFNFVDYHQYEINFQWVQNSGYEWGGIKITNELTGFVYIDTSTLELYSPNPIIVPLTALPGNQYKIELFRGNNN